MEIAFPINKLLKSKLTPDEFSICLLLDEGKTGLLKELAKLKGMSFYDNIKHLGDLGYVNYNTIGNVVDIKDLTITDEFKKLIAFGDPFMELYNKYPVRVTRPDGEQDYLRQYKNKCKTKYLKILNKNPLLHEQILDCLSIEKKKKQKEGAMGYFKRMYNWLESREWEKYEEDNYRFKNATKPLEDKKESVAYGQKLL